MMAHFTLGHFSRYSFGNRWLFGIECEIQNRPGEPYGSFCYWIAGQLVCNPEKEDLIGIAVTVVLDAVDGAGRRPDERFAGLTASERLSLVDWARFGEDDTPEAKRWAHYGRTGFLPYRIIPKDGGPWFDGWEGILTETDDSEFVVWRRAQTDDVQNQVLPKGTFVKVASEFCSWFAKLREERRAAHERGGQSSGTTTPSTAG